MTEWPSPNRTAKPRSAFFAALLSALLLAPKFTVMFCGGLVVIFLAKVMVVGNDETAGLAPTADLVAVTMHVPALLTPSESPETAQPVAVPLVARNETEPPPGSPFVESARGVPTARK